MRHNPQKSSSALRRFSRNVEQIPVLFFLIRRILPADAVSFLAGSASALFLISSDLVTETRKPNSWLIALLPVSGLVTGWVNHYSGRQGTAVQIRGVLAGQYSNP